MNTVLIEPTDLLFFRDAIPMSAGQGKGAGCRMPFPSTLHEAFRSSLLRANGGTTTGKNEEGRPRHAPKRGNWHDRTWPERDRRFIASHEFRSLRTIGPLPLLLPSRDGKPLVWKERRFGQETGVEVSYSGLLLPTPADVAFQTEERREQSPDGSERKWSERLALRRLQLWRDASVPVPQAGQQPSDYRPLCLPMAVTPPDKHGQLSGWWTVNQFRAYLDLAATGKAREDNAREFFRPVPTDDLWEPEHRIGVEIEPDTFAAKQGQLYAGTHLRAHSQTRFAAWTEVADPAKAQNGEADARRREREQLSRLDWLLLGGEFRLARLWQTTEAGQPLPDYLADLKQPPSPPARDGPCLLKWVLVTPAIFAHGNVPGWCVDTKKDRQGSQLPNGHVCFEWPDGKPLRAQLISWCLGKPRVVSGWDVVEGRAKPTMLAVPEGGVYYFLCEDRGTAAALANKLQWQPRSDFYGEKGCGYGLCSFAVDTHAMSPDVRALAKELFNQ